MKNQRALLQNTASTALFLLLLLWFSVAILRLVAVLRLVITTVLRLVATVLRLVTAILRLVAWRGICGLRGGCGGLLVVGAFAGRGRLERGLGGMLKRSLRALLERG